MEKFYQLRSEKVMNTFNLNEIQDCRQSVSPAFNSTKKPELVQIIFILRKLKELILNR